MKKIMDKPMKESIIKKSSTIKELLLIKIITNFIIGGLLLLIYKMPYIQVLNNLDMLAFNGSHKSQIIFNIFCVIGNIICLIGLFNIFLGMLLAFILILRKDDYKYISLNGKKLLSSFDIIGQTIITYRELTYRFSKPRKSKIDRFLFFISKTHLHFILSIFVLLYTAICFIVPVQGILMILIIFIIFIIRLSNEKQTSK